VLELRDCVPAVLARPTMIYRGLRFDNDDPRGQDLAPGWLCYCGLPSCRYDLRTEKKIGISDRVLLVFVNQEWIVYHHHWCESADELTPIDADDRFRERLL